MPTDSPDPFDPNGGFFKPFEIINRKLNETDGGWGTVIGNTNNYWTTDLPVLHNLSDSIGTGFDSPGINCSLFNGTHYNGTLLNTTNCPLATSGGKPEPVTSDTQAAMITFYTLSIALAVIGNLLSITIFSTGRRSKGDLRTYLLNLALADLSMAIFCMPFTFPAVMYRYWPFGEVMCTMVQFLQTVSVTVSVTTNMAIGMDRFLAVTFPMRSRATRKPKTKVAIVILIWILAVGLAAPILKVGRSVELDQYPGYYQCTEVWPEGKDQKTVYGVMLLIFTYITPLTILAVAYGLVAHRLWHRQAPGEANKTRDVAQLQSKKKVIKMLVIIVILFAVCWLPLHFFINLLDFNPELPTEDNMAALEFLYVVFHMLAMSNSFQNPLIYGFLNDNFRADLRDLILCVFPCCQCQKTKYFRNHRRMSYTSAHLRWSGHNKGNTARWQNRNRRNGSTSSEDRNQNKRNGLHVCQNDTELLTISESPQGSTVKGNNERVTEKDKLLNVPSQEDKC